MSARTILPIDDRARETGPVLIVFVDGVGLAPAAPGNPFAERPLPGFAALAGGPLVAGCARGDDGRNVAEADATLGVDGLPQSGTGQTTLFTGVNAAQAMGRHVPAFPGPRLRAIIEAAGLLAKVRRAGRSVAFANAFTPSYLSDLEAGKRRASVTVHAATSAGVRLRAETDLVRDQAVTWDFERDFYRRAAGEQVPAISAAQAGAHLAALAVRHDLTLYETFLTDLAGHGRLPITAVEAIERVDRFLAGLLASRDQRLTLVLCSDHGNVEEPDHRRHTRNRVPVAALGPLARYFAAMSSIVELTPAVLRALGVSDAAARAASGAAAVTAESIAAESLTEAPIALAATGGAV